MIEHRLLERHRDLLLGLEAHRGLELVGVLDRRQPQGANDDPLVGDAEADPAAQLVLGEERAQRRRQHLGVGHLAVVEDRRLGSGAIAVAESRGLPLMRTSAAAMLPASISSPTSASSFFSFRRASRFMRATTPAARLDRPIRAESCAFAYLELEKLQASALVSLPTTQADCTGSMKFGGST